MFAIAVVTTEYSDKIQNYIDTPKIDNILKMYFNEIFPDNGDNDYSID
jgi:hypothetical protein